MNKGCYYLFGLKLPLYLNFVLPVMLLYNPLAKLLKNKYFQLILIIALPSIIFVRILRNDPFFLSDDFAHLQLVYENSYLDIAGQALRSGGIWVNHRIIFAFWLFKGIYEVFGTNVISYLSVMYLIQIVNVFLFFLVLKKIIKKHFLVVLIAIIYSSFYLTWISNIHEVLAGTFVLLALFSWINFLESRKWKFYWLVIVFYLLGLFTKEITFLLGPALVLFTIFYNNYVRKINLRKIASSMFLILIIFLFYFQFFASSFLAYTQIAEDGGYKIRFSSSIFIDNLTNYTNMLLPIVGNSSTRLFLITLSAIAFDIRRRKLVAIPLFLSYLLLIAPPSFFSARSSNYYVYIPSVFFYLFLFSVFYEIYLILKKYYDGRGIGAKILKVYSIIGILVGIFGVNKIIMDNCFLIQFPWQKPQKAVFLSLVDKIDEKLIGGELKNGDTFVLNDEESALELGGIAPFLKSKEALGLGFRYLPEQKVLLVENK